MNKLVWTTDRYETVGEYQVPCVPNLTHGYNQGSGIKRNSKWKLMLKSTIWPIFKLRNVMIDDFIEWETGRLIRRYVSEDSVFLDIGCGDMSLRRYLPSNIWYNALDLELSDFHIIRALRSGRKVNLVVASAAAIPALPDTASLIVSTETLHFIPGIDETMQEIHRVATPDAIFICSISNYYCDKYNRKGPNRQHANKWRYQEFIEYVKGHHFEFIEGFMKGKWIPFPLWMTNTSYQLPVSSRSEYHNTNFFYVFKARK